MNYYHIRTYTPFCGEEVDAYIKAETITEFQEKAGEATFENGMEWYDEGDWYEAWGFDREEDDADAVIEEYYAQCGWRFVAMITEEEYNRLNGEGEWCV